MTSTTTDEREELRETLHGFFERYATQEDVRRLQEDDAGYDGTAWRLMAEQLGLQGLAIAEDEGGSGFGFEELAIVFEEMGATLFPSPFFATVALAATALQHSGDDAARQRYLPSIASGEIVATLAVSEADGGWDETVVRTRAERVGDSWRLTGEKRFVVDAHVSDVIFVVARAAEGVSLFAVDPTAGGCEVEVELTMDQTRKLARVSLDAAPAELVGTVGEAWDGVRRTLRIAAAALAAEQIGGAQRVLDMTVEYVQLRHQFGRPVGSFQAVKHRIADLLVEIESAKSAAYDAGRAVADGDDDLELAVSVAKAVCSDTYYRAAAEAIQLHGGIGFTWEHSAHLYFKRATSSRFLLGTPEYHRDLVGASLGI